MNSAFEGLFERRSGSAAVLTCIDERIVPESIFSCRPGELVCVRIAGNIAPLEVLESLQMAAARGCARILVLGHADCRAVQAAKNRDAQPLESIRWHINWATWRLSGSSVRDAAAANVLRSVSQIRSALPSVSVRGAMFDESTGEIGALNS